MIKSNKTIAKPFLKWAGGKTQLLSDIESNLPEDIKTKNYTFIEPFIGGGSVMLWILNKYPNIKNAIINDINKDLTNCYITIKNNVNELINILRKWENEYHKLNIKKAYYYQKRELFNLRTSNQIIQSALLIFLNKTCFNGLYRVNRKNEFNVPIGSYKSPNICNSANLLLVSKILQNVTILNGDYTETIKYVSKNTLFYLDPPYKPLSDTSNFNSYSKEKFDDEEQIRLKEFCDKIDKEKHKWILSNSDVNGQEIKNDFFDILYSDFNIVRVNAKRSINTNGNKRGKLTELLIKN